MSSYSAPRKERYHKYKKVLYLEPPTNGSKTVRTRITTVIPAPAPPPSPPALPEPEPECDSIEVIAVDVEPSVRSHKSSKSSKSSRSSRSRSHGRVDTREVYIEREKLVPVPMPYPVRVEPDYETYRYVDAPRRYEPRRRSHEREIIIEDHRSRHYLTRD
jgi:hypothetical protein